MRFLLKNAIYYDPFSYLNTTSAYKCFLVPEATTILTTEDIVITENPITTNDVPTTTATSTETTTTTTYTSTRSTISIGVATTPYNVKNTTEHVIPYSTFIAVVIPISVVGGLSLIAAIGLVIKVCCFPPQPQVVPSYNMRNF